MEWLILAAGIIGIGVTVMHGVLGEKLLRSVFEPPRTQSQQIVASVFHLSTYYWLTVALALLFGYFFGTPVVQTFVSIAAIIVYLPPGIGNLVQTRGRDLGWIPLILASVCSIWFLLIS